MKGKQEERKKERRDDYVPSKRGKTCRVVDLEIRTHMSSLSEPSLNACRILMPRTSYLYIFHTDLSSRSPRHVGDAGFRKKNRSPVGFADAF